MPPDSRFLKAIDRIRKLVALARGGATEAEAEQAMRTAHALLARHNLALEDVLAQPSPTPKVRDRVNEVVDAANNAWERPIWNATASLYFCRHYYERRLGRVNQHLIGRPHNVLVARLMTDYFLKTVRRISREEARTYLTSERGSFIHSFRVACAERLATRIWERKRGSQIHSTQADREMSSLPALRPLYQLEEEGNQALLDLEGVELTSSRRARTRITHILGEVAGKRAAESIGIDPQLRDGGLGDRSHGKSRQMELPL